MEGEKDELMDAAAEAAMVAELGLWGCEWGRVGGGYGGFYS